MQQKQIKAPENKTFSNFSAFLAARKENVNLWCASHNAITHESQLSGQAKS